MSVSNYATRIIYISKLDVHSIYMIDIDPYLSLRLSSSYCLSEKKEKKYMYTEILFGFKTLSVRHKAHPCNIYEGAICVCSLQWAPSCLRSPETLVFVQQLVQATSDLCITGPLWDNPRVISGFPLQRAHNAVHLLGWPIRSACTATHTWLWQANRYT